MAASGEEAYSRKNGARKGSALDANAGPLMFGVTRLVFTVIALAFCCSITHEVHGRRLVLRANIRRNT